ncbi:methyl-accepting chemotaxis protein [Vibrio sp. Of7-15]|uniref:methyl-accepting chemotaxis protein n=1 Tax=Vibrio sp. Of7-15 TaxID=2724879 RepID=UPI001EF2ABB3|nr:methyl-accepting chemotaxis protein [Vibrio sp. Of7-15]MCG7497092.1 methyl-accepting chemotaxis protein [Vibrio sp. Of7-15]
MNTSVIRRMYAAFTMIVVLFITTVVMMLNSTGTIHTQLESVTTTSMPLVTLSNQTSVQLLAADKSFKDYLTSQEPERMAEVKKNFSSAHQEFKAALANLQRATDTNPTLSSQLSALLKLEQRYFSEAETAMSNYQSMLSAQALGQQASRQFQQLHTELSVRMKEYVDDQNSISVKVMAKSYFLKLKDAEVVTSDALASSDEEFVKKAVTKNKKAVTHLNYAYRGLTTQLPALKSVFDKSVNQFSQDVGKKGGVLDIHFNYIQSKNKLYANIATLAAEIDNAITLLDAFNDEANRQMTASLQEAEKAYDQGFSRAIALGVIVSLLSAGIGWSIAQSVRVPLKRTLLTLEALTNGDMTQRIEIKHNNEFAQLGKFINTLADNLQGILIKLNKASDELTAVAAKNQTITATAQQQLNEQREQTGGVAAAMTQMEHSVHEVAQSSQSSLEKVHQVEAASETGRTVMSSNISTVRQLSNRLDESVQAVSNLQHMSSEIGSILDVIRNIADQTNLLALNAAIEAARAGEQGRGFAVVADEVRVLAKRTTDSTSEIESMISNLQSSSHKATRVIESCVSDMEQSVSQASDANGAMEEIQALILEISQMSSHISQAAAEQTATSSEIARSLEGISSISDENYAAMNQVSQASHKLDELASQQNELVHQFKL